MTTVDSDTIRELVQTENYRATGKTGEKIPSSIDGWNRCVELRQGTSMVEYYVDTDTWEELCDADWFPYDA